MQGNTHSILEFIQTKARPVTRQEILETLQSDNKEIDELIASNQIIEFKSNELDLQLLWIDSGSKRTPQDDLRDQIKSINDEIQKLTEEEANIEDIGNYVDVLHEYNDLKDTGQTLLGQLATIEGVTTKEMYKRYKLQLED